MTEIFKPIEGYEGYSVSNTGKVLNNKTEKFLEGSVDTKGYIRICLYKDKKGTLVLKHRLIAEAFIPNPENKPCVDHHDNNPSNNVITNLRWATRQENCRNQQYCRGSSGVKGVTWHKHAKKWNAQIGVGGINIYLGTFDKIEDAILARQTYANEAFGEFVNDCETPK